MAQYGGHFLLVSLILAAGCLQACADGTLQRDDVNHPGDNPFPALELTSSDTKSQERAWYLPVGSHPLPFHETPAWLPVGSHPLAFHETPADAGAPSDAGEAAESDAGDAAPGGDTQ